MEAARAAEDSSEKGVRLMGAPDAVEMVRAMAASKASGDALKAAYALCKAEFIQQGWLAEELEELSQILKVDLGEGPGVERPFRIAQAERRALWMNWFLEKTLPDWSAEVTARIRAEIAEERAKAPIPESTSKIK